MGNGKRWKFFTVERENNYAVITFSRPPVNAIDQETVRELSEVLDEVGDDGAIKALVVTATGAFTRDGAEIFSAGADTKEFDKVLEELPSLEAYVAWAEEASQRFRELYGRIERFPRPVIAAINGHALGGGLELLLVCHLRIAAEGVELSLPEVRRSLIPGAGGTQRLPRLIGKTRALGYLLTGDPMSATEAERLGLINKVVPRDQLLEEAKSLAARLSRGRAFAAQAILKAVNRGFDLTMEEGLDIEQEMTFWNVRRFLGLEDDAGL